MKKVAVFTCSISILFSLNSSAQSTFSNIQSIMQASCAASGCHGGGNAVVFDVTASSSDLYDAIVDVPAANLAAAEKGNKIVDPGHPYNSFLLRKIGSNNFDPFIKIDVAERNGHPSPLQNFEIELIRQWILAGAQETGNVADYALIQDYYANGGLDFIPVPPAPAPDKGFQLRYGPIFIAANGEKEMMKQEHLKNQQQIKISQMAGYMSWESHHMLLFKTDDNNTSREGTRLVPVQGFPFNGGTLTGAWQNDGDFKLPDGTAFYWDKNTILDFDYHVKNYSQTEILPADFYMNIYYNDDPTPPIEMFADLENVTVLALNAGQNDLTRTHDPGETRYIWMLSSHTHKYGTDYDLFLRNPDGTKGDQIYEGFYNEEYTYNQGYFDYQHPPIRYFEPLKMAPHGLIYQTKWDIDGPCTSILSPLVCINFGLTTNDEMMLFTYLYTKQQIAVTGITEVKIAESFSAYPNPMTESTKVSYSIDKSAKVKVELFDVMGKNINTIADKELAAGTYSDEVTSEQVGNTAGVYFVTISVDGNKLATRKITKL